MGLVEERKGGGVVLEAIVALYGIDEASTNSPHVPHVPHFQCFSTPINLPPLG